MSEKQIQASPYDYLRPLILNQYPDLDIAGWLVEFGAHDLDTVDDIDQIIDSVEDWHGYCTEENVREVVINVVAPPKHMFLRLVKEGEPPILLLVNLATVEDDED